MNLLSGVSASTIDFRTRIVIEEENGQYKVELNEGEMATHLVLMPYTAQTSVSVGRDFTGGELVNGDADIVPHADYAVKKDANNFILKHMVPLDAVHGTFYINGITGTCYVFVLINPNIA